ncbi:MAG: MFS transporter [Candidatus Sericytochromatia bacterium]
MKNFALITVLLTVFLDIFGFGIIIPLLPFYAKQFGADEGIIGVLIASTSLAQFLFNPIWGKMSDKHGRKPIMILTSLGSVVGYFLFGFANSLTVLFISRILSGAAGATIGVAQSYISDITTVENRAKALGMVGAAFGLGFVFGPAVTGLLSNLGTGHGTPGYLASFLSLINFIMIIYFLPESNKTEKKVSNEEKADINVFQIVGNNLSEIWKNFKQITKDYDMAMLFLIQFIAMLSISNLFATCALFLEKKFGYTERENAFVFAYFGICSAFVQGFLINKLTKRYSEKKLLVISSIFMTIGMAALPFAPNIIWVGIITAAIFFGNSVMNPCLTSLITKRTKKEMTGVTLGLSQSLGSFARIFGPLWGGYIFKVAGYPYPYITGAILGVLVIALSLKFLAEKEQKEPQEEILPV